jgi:hypothetical protein
MVGVDDPVALGVVQSLAQPGSNVTGFSLSSTELLAKRLQLLQELVPGLRRFGVIVRGDPGLEQKLQDIRRNAALIGIEPLMLDARTGTALRLAFARLNSERCEAIYAASGPLGPAKRAQLIAPGRHPIPYPIPASRSTTASRLKSTLSCPSGSCGLMVGVGWKRTYPADFYTCYLRQRPHTAGVRHRADAAHPATALIG